MKTTNHKHFWLMLGLFAVQILIGTAGIAQQPQPGDAIVTCFSGSIGAADPSGKVIGVLHVQSANTVPLNVNWAVPKFMGPQWTAQNLGEIFGIAQDKDGHIFVTATSIYGGPTSTTNFPWGPGGAGGIYRIDRNTHAVSVFKMLPNTNDINRAVPFASLGNICYDSKHDQFFVTNLDDGKIYRLNASDGTTLSVYDPFIQDGGTAGFCPLDERVWGIAYFNDRVFFSRWSQDFANTAGAANQICYVDLVPATGQFTGTTYGNGDFHSVGPELVAFTIPGDIETGPNTGIFYSNPVSDIEFSQSGNNMLLAERTWNGTSAAPFRPQTATTANWAHRSRLLEYTRVGTTWTASPPSKYKIGDSPLGKKNSAGGCDYGYETFDTTTQKTIECDSIVWCSGDALHFIHLTEYLYGFQRLPVTGGDVTNSVLIDADNNTNLTDKTQLGDIDILKNCEGFLIPPCGSIRAVASFDSTYGPKACCRKLNIINNAGSYIYSQITATVITPGVTIVDAAAIGTFSNFVVGGNGGTSTWTAPASGIPTGNNGAISFCFNIGVTTSQTVIFSFIGQNGQHCDTTMVFNCAPPILIPGCGSTDNLSVNCIQTGSAGNVFQMSFNLHNRDLFNSVSMASIVSSSSTAGAISVTPLAFNYNPTIPTNGVAPIASVLQITGAGAVPGATISLRFELSNPAMNWCCKFDTSFRLPTCANCCDKFFKTVIQPSLTDAGPGSTSTNHNSGIFTFTGNWTVNQPIVKATATLISAHHKRNSSSFPFNCTGSAWQSIMGDIIPTGPFGTLPYSAASQPFVSTPPGPFREVSWGTVLTGVNLTNAPMSFQIKLPPPVSSLFCTDSLRICMRFTFTDKECRTCDTVICRDVRRRGLIHWVSQRPALKGAHTENDVNGSRSGQTPQSFEEVQSSPIELGMKDNISGFMNIKLPQGSDSTFGITITSLQLETGSEASITGFRENGGVQATIKDRQAALPVSIGMGQSKSYSITYDNPNNAIAWDNYLTIGFVVDGEIDTFYQAEVLPSRTPTALKGDSLGADNSAGKPLDVRTYSLFFANTNKMQVPNSRVLLRVKDGRLLAVGGFEDSSSVLLAPTATKDGRILFAPNIYPDTVVSVGLNIKPIYVTVSGTKNNTITIEYTTYDSNGVVLTKGEVTLTDPLSAVRKQDPPMARKSAYLLPPFPNPAATMTSIQVHLDVSDIVKVSVVDALGKEVGNIITDERLNAGDNVFMFQTGELSNGTYYVTLRSSNGSDTKAFQVIH